LRTDRHTAWWRAQPALARKAAAKTVEKEIEGMASKQNKQSNHHLKK
jgi:hypothetical protein